MSIKSSVENLFYSDEVNSDEVAFNFNFDGEEEVPSYIQETIDSGIDYWLMNQEHSVPLQSVTLILTIISLIGVFLMYKLNNKGFIFYTIANLLLVVISFVYFFNNTVGQLVTAGQFFVTALFILLYASQLKYMSKDKEPLKL